MWGGTPGQVPGQAVAAPVPMRAGVRSSFLSPRAFLHTGGVGYLGASHGSLVGGDIFLPQLTRAHWPQRHRADSASLCQEVNGGGAGTMAVFLP